MNRAESNVQVRRMVAADLEQVMKLAATLPEAPQWPESAYRAVLSPESSPRRLAMVAEEVAVTGVVGFAIANLLPPQAELETIAVAPERRRRGLARQIFRALAAELQKQGADEILLEVRASNQTAIAFYRSMGLVQTGLRRGYYADPVEDAIQMMLRVT